MKRAYIDLSRGQMHYRHAGSGTPIVMIHMSGSSSDEFEKAGNILAENYSVYALDLYGFGNSDVPCKYLSFTEHMNTVIEFMDALMISRAYFVGNLVGANITIHLAAEHPERVIKAALFHPCYNPDKDFYHNLRHSAVFSEIPITEDGSHLKEIWARSAKYGEAADISNDRAIYLHKARGLGEALHWALCDDADFESFVKRTTIPAKIFAYDKMENKTTETAANLMGNCQYELLHGTPYFARANYAECAKKLLAFFS